MTGNYTLRQNLNPIGFAGGPDGGNRFPQSAAIYEVLRRALRRPAPYEAAREAFLVVQRNEEKD
jgi:hypothetical protein